MEIVVQVCDVCQVVGKPVEIYAVKQGSRTAAPALCADDAERLEFFLPQTGRTKPVPAKKAAKRVPKAPRSVRGGRQSGVMTMEEIEAQKARS